VKRKKSIFCTFGSLLLCCTSTVGFAQQVDACPRIDRGSVCTNQGTIINNTHIHYPTRPDSGVHPPTPVPSPGRQRQRNRFIIQQETVDHGPLTSNEEPQKPLTFPDHSRFKVKQY